jgi:hypothetical protein
LPIDLRPKREAPCLGGFAAENVSNRAIHHPRDFRLARESRARTSAERFTSFINVSRAPQPARCCRCRPADVRSSRLSREVLRARVVVADLGAVMYSALRCSRKTTAGPDEVREPTPNQSNAQRRRSPTALRPTHRSSPTRLTSTALQVIQRQQLGEYGRGYGSEVHRSFLHALTKLRRIPVPSPDLRGRVERRIGFAIRMNLAS